MRLRLFLTFAWFPIATVFVSAAGNAEVFANNCAGCHGADGSANTPQGRKLKARDLRDSQLSDAEIDRQIREGSKKKTGAVIMPAFGRELSDAQIQEAIATVKSFRPPATK